MTSSIILAVPAHAAGIANLAGQQDIERYWIVAGTLYVEDVEQAALEAAADAYDHAAFQVAALERRMVGVLNKHLDAVAAQRRYDNRFTCSLRAGYAGPFQAEGIAFAAFMDECNMVGYTIMRNVKLGLAPVPTEAELIAAMPPMVWPPSPIPEGAA